MDQPFRIEPPHLVQAADADGLHSQPWAEHHQSVADRLTELTAHLGVGVTDGSDAVAGHVGEYLSAVSSGSVSLANGTTADIATLVLTAGDWDVSGNIIINPTGATSVVSASVSTTSATLGPIATRVAGTSVPTQFRLGTGGDPRINVTAATTVYLVAQCFFSSGTTTATGAIWARRQR